MAGGKIGLDRDFKHAEGSSRRGAMNAKFHFTGAGPPSPLLGVKSAADWS
jgi:hypothetical protein